jgi:hypothetical protein
MRVCSSWGTARPPARPYTGTTWQAAEGYEAAEHQLRLAGSAARAAEVPIAAIVKVDGSFTLAGAAKPRGSGTGRDLT